MVASSSVLVKKNMVDHTTTTTADTTTPRDTTIQYDESPQKVVDDLVPQVEKALAARAKGAQLMVSYRTSPGILGGLVVKMGESVLDFSVLSRLDRLTTKLMAPM